MQPLNNVKDLFKADAYIVPGVSSVEIPPELAANQSKYYYSGPLILDDYAVEGSLKDFTGKNKDRTIVYLTYGLAPPPPAQIIACLTYILEKNMAVITNVQNDALRDAFRDTLYYSPFLPMHYVCQAADVIIHHCGCGAYHYPILHEKPWITLGTMRYDREDVALKLEELGLSTHLPAPEEENFTEHFKSSLENILAESSGQRGERMEKIVRIKTRSSKRSKVSILIRCCRPRWRTSSPDAGLFSANHSDKPIGHPSGKHPPFSKLSRCYESRLFKKGDCA